MTTPSSFFSFSPFLEPLNSLLPGYLEGNSRRRHPLSWISSLFFCCSLNPQESPPVLSFHAFKKKDGELKEAPTSQVALSLLSPHQEPETQALNGYLHFLASLPSLETLNSLSPQERQSQMGAYTAAMPPLPSRQEIPLEIWTSQIQPLVQQLLEHASQKQSPLLINLFLPLLPPLKQEDLQGEKGELLPFLPIKSYQERVLFLLPSSPYHPEESSLHSWELNQTTMKPFLEKISAEELATLLNGLCKEVDGYTLSIKTVMETWGAPLPLMLKACPLLHHVDLSFFSEENHLEPILQALDHRRVTSLNCRFTKIKSIPGTFRNLTHLNCMQCEQLESISHHLTQLQILQCSYSEAITSLPSLLPQLQILHCSGCKQLSSLPSELPQVIEISCYHMPQLKEISGDFSKLKKLGCMDCIQLERISGHFPQLMELKCSLNPQLHFLPPSLPSLQHIRKELCPKLNTHFSDPVPNHSELKDGTGFTP